MFDLSAKALTSSLQRWQMIEQSHMQTMSPYKRTMSS